MFSFGSSDLRSVNGSNREVVKFRGFWECISLDQSNMCSLGSSIFRSVLNRLRSFTIINRSNREFIFMNGSNREIIKDMFCREHITLNFSNMCSLGSSNLRSVLNRLGSFTIKSRSYREFIFMNGSNWESVGMNRKLVSLNQSNMGGFGSSYLWSVLNWFRSFAIKSGSNRESVVMNRSSMCHYGSSCSIGNGSHNRSGSSICDRSMSSDWNSIGGRS